jgi:RND family efflux transporter MFP subunit
MKKLGFAAIAAFALGGTLVALHASPKPERPRAIPAAALEKSRVVAEGRVVPYPGAQAVVGTDFAGTISRLLVNEKDAVAKGQLLAELDASAESAALDQARARVAESVADARLAESERVRAEALLASKVGTQQAVDKALRDRDAALAREATAEADVKRLAALVAKARIVAPLAGTVLERFVERGETVDRGARILTVADLGRLRIEAEVDEYDSTRVAVGMPVLVRAEGDESVLHGVVEEVPDSVTTRRIKPPDPARPVDTRVLLVKISLTERAEVKLGRRVQVEIGG